MKRILDPGIAVLSLGLMLPAVRAFGYPLLGLETLLAAGAALVLAAVVTVATASFPALRMAAIGYLFLSLVATALVPTYLLARITVSLGAALMGFLHKRLEPRFFVVFALVFAPLKYFQDMQAPAVDHQVNRPAAEQPGQILVHLVMDEMGSFASVPKDVRNDPEVSEIRDAYEKRGFRIHSDAPSVSWYSKDSLGTLVDIGRPTGGLANVAQIEGQDAYRILRNSLHHLYAANGWQVSIVQSSYLDFCRDPAWNCRTYQPGRNAYLFEQHGIPVPQRTAILGRLLLATLSGSPEPWRRTPDMPLSALSEMNVLLARAQAAHGKQYFFGHILLPHFPWTMDRKCRVNPLEEWRAPDLSGASEGAEYHASLTRGYWQQAYCAHKRILQAVDALDAAHPGKVRFLIHGDHGPRIIRQALPGGDEQVDEHWRSMLVPFVASRLESDGTAPSRGEAVTMQSVLQSLLVSEAAVTAYGRSSPDVRP